jgi:hypothetical protein
MKRYLKSKTYFSQLTASRGGLGTAGRHRDGVKRRPGEFMLCSQRTTDHGQLTKILCLLSLGCLLPPVSCKLKLPYALCAVRHSSKNCVFQGGGYIFEFKDNSVKLLSGLPRIDADGLFDPIPVFPAYLC